MGFSGGDPISADPGMISVASLKGYCKCLRKAGCFRELELGVHFDADKVD